MKKPLSQIALIFTFLFLSSFLYGQNTSTITGTVTDSDSQVWANASWTATTVVPGGGQAHYITGGVVPASTTGQLSTTGVISGSLPASPAIVPFGTTQRFSICSLTSAACQTLNPVSVPSSTFNAGAYISSQIKAPRIEATANIYAYNTSEILDAVQGSGYTNTSVPSAATQWLWNGALGWIEVAGGGGNTPNPVNFTGTPPGMIGFGDSITFGEGPSNVSLGYFNLLKPQFGGQWYNDAVVGNLCINVNSALISTVNNQSGSPNILHECGTNDVTQYGSNTNLETIFKRIVEGNLIFGSLPNPNLTYAQTCTKTTGFANTDNTRRYGLGQYTVLSGDVLTCGVTTTSNGEVALGYLISNASTGTFTVSINGTPQTDQYTSSSTFTSYGDGSANFSGGTPYTSAIVGQVFSGFPPNTFVPIVITSTAASTTAAPVEIDYVASIPSMIPSSTLIVVSPNHQNNANDALSGVYAGFEKTIQQNLFSLGFPVYYDNTRDALGTNFGLYFSDAIHPNQTGSALMTSTTTSTFPNLVTSLPTNLFNSAAFTYAPNATPPPNPSTWWTPNPSNQQGDGVSQWPTGGINLGGKGSAIGIVYNDPIRGSTVAGFENGSQSAVSLCAYNATYYAFAPSVLPVHCPVNISSSNFAVIGSRFTDGLGGMIGANGDIIFNIQSEGSAFGSVGSTYFGSTAGIFFLPLNNGTFSPGVSYPSVPIYFGINGCTASSTCGTVYTGWQAINSAGNSPTTYLTLVNKQSTNLPWGVDISTATQVNKLGAVSTTGINGGNYATATVTAIGGTNVAVTCPTQVCTSARGAIAIVGTASTTIGAVLTVTFGTPFATAPECIVSQNSGAFTNTVSYLPGHSTPSTNSFTIGLQVALGSASTQVDYTCQE